MPFVALIDQTATYKWTYRLWNSISTYAYAIAIKPDESEVIVAMGTTSSVFSVQRLSFSTGNYIQGYLGNVTNTTKYDFLPFAGSAVVLGSNLYLGLADSSWNAYILGFQLGTTAHQSSVMYQYSSSNPSSINRILSNNGGDAIIVSGSFTRAGSSDQYQMTILSFEALTGSLKGINYIPASSYSSIYQPQDTLYYFDGTDGWIYLTSVQPTSSSNLYFTQISYTDDYVNSISTCTAYQNSFSGAVSTNGLYLDTTLYSYPVLYAHIYESDQHSIVSVSFGNTVGDAIYQKLLSPLSGFSNTFIGARFWSTTQSFYIVDFHGANNLDGNPVYLNYLSAGLMSQSYTYSCLSDTNTFNILNAAVTNIGSTSYFSNQHNPMSQSGTYYVVDYSTSSPPGNIALGETIIKQTWCYHTVSVSIPTSYPTSYTYQIYEGSPYYHDYLPKFTAVDSSGDTCTDATFMYSFSYSSNSSNLQSPWGSSSFGAYVDLSSLTEIDAGTYALTIFGELTQDTYVNGSASFTITATNPCTAETVTATNPSNGLYYLSDATPLSLAFSNYFTNSDNPSCERTYAIYSDSACTTLANTTLFSFSNSSGKLQIMQSNASLYGYYTLYVKTTMFTNTAATAISTYTVYLSRCWLCTVSTTATIATDYYYDIGSSYISIDYGSWTNDFAADCGTVTLTITYGSNSTVVPTSGFAITQDTSANLLKVYTTNTSLAGSYTIDFKGEAGSYNIWLNKSTTVHLLIPCTLSVGSSNFPAETYTVNSQPVLTYQFTGFTPSHCLNSTITYQVTYDGSNTAPAWASFNKTTNNFTIDPKTNSYKGSHIIKVTGTIYEAVTNRNYAATGTWYITILPENTSPPVMNQPTDQTVKTGTTTKYSLPSISDPDGDGWSVSTNMGSASSFIQYSSGSFTIAPTIANTGTFTISITLTDNNLVPLSSQYSFTVTVTSATTSKSSSSNSTNSTSNSTSTFAGVVITALSPNATNAEKAAWEQKMILYESFGAKIASISETGLVKIQFLDPIIVPNVNLSMFNDSYLDVTAITGIYNDPNNDLFTWSATYLDQYYLELQVTFQSPQLVSLDVSHQLLNLSGLRQFTSGVYCQWLLLASIDWMAHQGEHYNFKEYS